jgi:hypothetical protein
MDAACDKQHGGETNTDAKHGNPLGSHFFDLLKGERPRDVTLTSRGEEAAIRES